MLAEQQDTSKKDRMSHTERGYAMSVDKGPAGDLAYSVPAYTGIPDQKPSN